MTESSPPWPVGARRGGLVWHRDFRRLWAGDAISQVGTQISYIAMPLVAVQVLHASAFEVGALTACETAAFLFVGLPAGAWCDRVRRRPVLVLADVGRAAVLASVPVAAVAGVLTIGQLFAVALLTGVLTVFFDVAYQSYLPSLVGRAGLVEGNSKLEATRGVSVVAGPALGGWLVQVFTAPYAIVADAVSYLWSASWITAIGAREPAVTVPERRDLRREIGEGMRFVLGHPLLRRIAGCTGTANFFAAAIQAVAVVFLVRQIHVSAGLIGLLFGAGSAGAVVGALTAARLAHSIGQGRVIVLAVTVAQPAAFLLPLTDAGWRLWLFAAGMFVLNIGVVVYNVAQVSFRQALAPQRLLGRMNATMRFLVWGTMPIGGLVGGGLASWLGTRETLWICAAGGLLAPLWVLLSPLRSTRDLPASPTSPTSSALPDLPHP